MKLGVSQQKDDTPDNPQEKRGVRLMRTQTIEQTR